MPRYSTGNLAAEISWFASIKEIKPWIDSENTVDSSRNLRFTAQTKETPLDPFL